MPFQAGSDYSLSAKQTGGKTMYFKKLTMGLFKTNCYIFADEKSKDAVIIDPCTHADRIMNEIKLNSFTVRYIILTHAHIDHMMALDEVKAQTGAPIAVGAPDAASVNSGSRSLAEHFHSTAPQSKPDIMLNDGDVLNIGSMKLQIISTPGHTPGGISIYCASEKILFSGDTLFFESVGRTDFNGGSFEDISNSIRKKLFALPPDTAVYPGHSCETTILHEKESNFYI